MGYAAATLGILFAIFIAVMMGGQLFDVQATGDDLSGAPGTFFSALPSIWIILSGIIAGMGLLAVIGVIMRR